MHRYEDALFHQVEHLRFLNSPMGSRIYEGFDQQVSARADAHDADYKLPDGFSFAVSRRIVERAEPVYVSPQIIDTLNEALPSFVAEPLLPTDLFTAEGFAYLPKPVYVRDVHGTDLPIRAMGWTPIRGQLSDGMEAGGVWVLFFAHRDDDVPGVNLSAESVKKLRAMPHATLTPAHSFWMPYNDPSYVQSVSEEYRTAAQRQWCSVQVLWRLAGQVVKTVTLAPRAARRDAKRHGVDQDHVVVVTLRKVKAITSGGELVESEGRGYSVQFVVRGHWRAQWYPSLGHHRQIWIDAHWKGDPEAPIQNSRRVFEVTR